IRSWYIASALAEAGHEVEIITGNAESGYFSKKINGFTVHYLPIRYANSFSKSQRLFAFARFVVSSVVLCFRLGKFDKTYATSTPLTVGLIALILKWCKGIPYIFEVRDLWPDAPIQIGYIRSPIFKWVLFQLEKLCYNKAESIVALSPGIKNGILQKSNGKNVYLVPNMSDCERFLPTEKDIENESVYGTKDKFVVSYTGATGFSNHLEYLLDAALACQTQNLNHIQFLIAGEGSQTEILHKKALEMGLQNLQFLGPLNKFEIEALLNVTDAVYISFAQFPILETNSPNKFFDGLAAGKIMISNTGGWIKDLIEGYAMGFYYDPNKPAAFAEELGKISSDPFRMVEMKKNARKLAEERFSVKKLTQEITDLFR
ncbi:MAG: glycosyltransferase family 4 protein, partial [Cytophagales bacterium]|nr:glycosyltransferase family 4 protein [Cytophagales bacterium]